MYLLSISAPFPFPLSSYKQFKNISPILLIDHFFLILRFFQIYIPFDKFNARRKT